MAQKNNSKSKHPIGVAPPATQGVAEWEIPDDSGRQDCRRNWSCTEFSSLPSFFAETRSFGQQRRNDTIV